MGSSRLPGKVLMHVGPRRLLDHVVMRAAGLRLRVPVVVATGTSAHDDAIEARCRSLGVSCFRGEEDDVLGRYVACMRQMGFDQVIRLTADNPFTDIAELDRLVDLHVEERNDYSESVSALPVGVGAEIFSAACLSESDEKGKAPHHREHVNEYVLENVGRFRIGHLGVPAVKARPDVSLTIDTMWDYRRACFIAENARSNPICTEEAIALCSRFA